MPPNRLGQALPAVLIGLLIAAGGIGYLLFTDTPYATLSGRVILADGKAPPVKLRVFIYGDHGVFRTTPVDHEGNFRARLPVGQYTVGARTRSQSLLKPLQIALAEGEQQRVELRLQEEPGTFEVIVHQHVTPTGEPGEIAVQGHVKDAALRVRLYRVDLRKLSLEERGNLRKLADPQWRFQGRIDAGSNPGLKLAAEKQELITTRDAEGMFYQRVKVEMPAPGVYLATVEADLQQELAWVMQTDIALLTKSDRERMLAQVCELVSGRPVPGAQVEVFRGTQSVHQGRTDGQGLLPVQLPATTESEPFTVIATSAGSEAFVTPYLSSSTQPPLKVHFVTDRPVYRPGHTVQFRLLVRRPDGARYTVPKGEPVQVQVRDPNSNLLFDKPLRLNEWGSCAGEVQLSDEAASGEYVIECQTEPYPQSHYFTVAAYRKPEYEVTVKPEQERVVEGDTITTQVEATYYFGSPVPNAQVEYNVYSSPYWYWEPDEAEESDYEFFDAEDLWGYDTSGEVVASGETRTDAAGRATLRLPTKRRLEAESDRQYVIEATVTDASGRSVTEEATVVVLRGEYLITLDPEAYITEPGKPVEVGVRVRNWEKQPVPNLALQVGWQREEWDARKSHSGRPTLQQVTTDQYGNAKFNVTPDRSGDYRIIARAVDSRGNRIVETSGLWCTSALDPVEARLREGVKVTLDRRIYQPGDTARALISSAEPVATALLTIEGERLHDWRVISLQQGTTLVELPVLPEYLPNAYVCVTTVYKQDMHQAQGRLNVSPREHGLRLSLTPDKAEYRPGEQATCTVQALDAAGKPTRAEVALSVVDEAIYAIAPDQTAEMMPFFYSHRYNAVNTDYSFPSIYLSADKAGVPKELRKDFRDTAYWNPSVVTDERGQARVSFKVPDSLTEWRLTAHGATLDTNVGDETGSFLCRKRFFVRLETPRFLVSGDRARLGVIIHNETGAPLQAQVSLPPPSSGADVQSWKPVRVDATPMRLDSWYTASTGTFSPQKATLTVAAESGQWADAVQLTLPCQPFGRIVRSQAAGVAAPGRESAGEVTLEQGNMPVKLQVRLSNSLLATTLSSLDMLAQYPYGCAEQTMSAFLPDVVLYDTLRAMNRPTKLLGKDLPQMVQDGLFRLYDMQNSDGGWGWWSTDQPNVWMTAYVLYGMALAKQAGFPVNAGIYSGGVDALQTYVQQMKDLKKQDVALAALVLAQAGRKALALDMVGRLRLRRDLGAYELAVMTRALLAAGEREAAQGVLDQLFGMVQETSNGAYWPSNDPNEWLPGTTATAEGLIAVLEMDPQDERADRLIRWLVGARRGSGWVSTVDTAAGAIAFCRYLRHHPPSGKPMAAEVIVNGQALPAVQFTAATTEQPEALLVVPAQSLRAGANQVVVRTAGPDEVWWTAELRQIAQPTAAGVAAGSEGMSIESTLHRYGRQRSWNSGVVTMQAEKKARSRFRAGEVIEGQVRVLSAQALDYAMVEVPIPAGCEVMTRGDLDPYEWDEPYSGRDVRDDKVVFFIGRLEAGKAQELTYRLRALSAGSFHVSPAQLSGMYQPDRCAYTAGRTVSVQ
jgi:hypothetical protein